MMVSDTNKRYKIDLQLDSFNDAKGLFGIEAAKTTRDKKNPAKWLDSCKDEFLEPYKFAIRVLSLIYSSKHCSKTSLDLSHTCFLFLY